MRRHAASQRHSPEEVICDRLVRRGVTGWLYSWRAVIGSQVQLLHQGRRQRRSCSVSLTTTNRRIRSNKAGDAAFYGLPASVRAI